MRAEKSSSLIYNGGKKGSPMREAEVSIFFSNKEKTQEELFHLFNVLSESNKQIIFSSDEHPNFIPGLEDRLKSRFSAGMIVDISQPDYESRVAILKQKSSVRNFFPSDDVVEYLASSLDVNIRELEGILNTLICQAQMKSGVLGIDDVKSVIKNSVKPKKTASVKDVVKTVAGFYNIDESSIYAKTRRKEIVRPRQVIMYLLREEFNISYPTIGEKLGGRDHTTVIHSYEKIKEDIKRDRSLQQELDQIRLVL
ncbi:MAG: DnaA/Hda family protein [Patescibacteria group bacterium]